MYHEFFGLGERPFDLTANPRFLFLSGGHREALSLLRYGLIGERGVTVLIGEAGTGKTTLLRVALTQHRDTEVLPLHLHNPALTRLEFYEFLAHGLGLRSDVAQSKTVFLREMEHRLTERRKSGKLTALIVDEAQAVPAEVLEEVRMLANLEWETAKLLSIVLTGQPELGSRLNEPGLRPLKQRVALRTLLPALRLQETAGYIAKRVRVAGGDPCAIFAPAAVRLVHQVSGGIPRTINVICDNALMTAFALRQKPVTDAIVAEVCKDLDLDIEEFETGRFEASPAQPEEGARLPDPETHLAFAETVPVELLRARMRDHSSGEESRSRPTKRSSNDLALVRVAAVAAPAGE